MGQPEKISGPQRAAAFLLSLDREETAAVLKHLDENVIVEVVEAMAQLDAELKRPESIHKLDRDFIRALTRPRGARLRSETDLRELLEMTLGKSETGSLFEKIHTRLVHERPFLALERAEPAHLAAALASESDAVCALVLAHVEPQLSAEVLSSLQGERALAIVQRMAGLVPPGFETLLAIAQDLERRVLELAASPAAPLREHRLKSVAEILTFARPDVEHSVLEGISEGDAQMATDIRELMFTWEDLATVDRRIMQRILSSIDTRTLAVALKACSEGVQDNIMANLSARVREMVKEERELAGALPMLEVNAARDEIMRAVRTLMEAGEFRPSRGGEELVS